VTDELGERRTAWAPPQRWMPVRVTGARFAVPPAWIVEASPDSVRAWNRQQDPDRTFLLNADQTVAGARRQAARVIAAAEANGDRVVAESQEDLDGVPAVRVVFVRPDGGTTVAYVTVHRGRVWELRIVIAPDGENDAVVEFERIVATFRFDEPTADEAARDVSDEARSGA
jgi:hypothetical protein